MKRVLIVTALVLAFSLLTTGVALAADGEGNQATAGEVALVLAPLVAAATAVERLIEMVFDGYESAVLGIGNMFGEGKGYLKWARQQVREWHDTITQMQGGGPGDPAVAARLSEAENALASAQDRLIDFLNAPAYTSRKRVISLGAGIVLGVIVAFIAKLQMLAMIASLFGWQAGAGGASPLAQAGSAVDMLLTGLIIGTGSAPVHSLIGLLQNTKDAVDKARALWAGSAANVGAQAAQLIYAGAPPEPGGMYIARRRAYRAAADEDEVEEGAAPPAGPPVGAVEARRRVNRLLR